MSKNFRREQFGNSGFAKFPDYTKTLPPPSGKNEENKKPINLMQLLRPRNRFKKVTFLKIAAGQDGGCQNESKSKLFNFRLQRTYVRVHALTKR